MKRQNHIISIALILSLLFLMQAGANATKYPLKIKDCRNRLIIIEKEPKRIVSLTPNNTEILFAIGAGKKVVGVNKWSDYPPEAKKLPSVGDRIISIEKVLSLRPDLVLAHNYLNDSAIRVLEAQKIKVFVIDPRTIDQLCNDIITIGKITNTEKNAKVVANNILKTKAAILARTRNMKQRPKVLFAIQTDPLWVAGPGTFVDEIIRIAGGTNIAYDLKPGFNQFSTEIAVKRNPDIIITTSKGDKKLFISGQWKVTSAAKNGRVYEIDPDIIVRPGPRLVQGMKKIAEMVHPSAKK